MRHLRYLRYVLRHRWYVLLECWRLGIPWAGLMHDLSKFRPDEWFPYVESFYGNSRKAEVDYAYAWLHHQRRNPHHWQYWLLVQDEDKSQVLPMPNRYRKEMLADWRGAGRAQGYGDNTSVWYHKHQDKMMLAPETRAWIERALGLN